ncbi:hypothetical protein DSM104443_01552 [Usitatibacter rugosus]|uniref:RNase H-like nuclease n=1 Tax=Usitatibacter rugosus TaxID=2732067 RepID=A0A6M4GUF5_9PROT|nr:hypothetical protein DSM104443_01552 [Usitatibacter rugosus]
MKLAGVDGCKGGWIYVLEGPSGVSAGVEGDLEALMRQLSGCKVVCVDIPIGFSNEGQRDCDRAARQMLGRPRGSSVFSPAVRSVVEMNVNDYRALCEEHRRVDGRGLSQQSVAILPKMREVDVYLRAHPDCLDVVREVHPEVCFAAWNGGTPMQLRKSLSAGAAEREAIVDSSWPGFRSGLVVRGGPYARDDLNDAIAALWTARRVAKSAASPLGGGARDSRNLPMEIWY